MADITKSLLEINAGADVTVVDGAAEATIDLEGRGDENYMILIENTDTVNDAMVSFNAGVGLSADQGDLEVDVVAEAFVGVGYLESARFKNADGKIDVEVLDPDGSAFTGTEADVKFIVVEAPKQL